jgi:hypothetical protein
VRRARLPDDVAVKLSGVVAATIDIYNSIRAELLPTPAKSHYTYNMRDLSKVFQVRWCCSKNDTLNLLPTWLFVDTLHTVNATDRCSRSYCRALVLWQRKHFA